MRHIHSIESKARVAAVVVREAEEVVPIEVAADVPMVEADVNFK